MSLIKEYLRWQYFGDQEKEPRYQLLTWEPSQLIAGFQTVVIPNDPNSNCLFIETELMSISTDGLGGVISFKDQRMNTNLFSIINNTSIYTMNRFDYLIPDSRLIIVSTSATVQFSVAYCRITTDKKVNKR